MKTIPIWIVDWRTGEYDDYREWQVAACVSEASAKRLVAECLEWARAFLMVREEGERRLQGDFRVRREIENTINAGLVPEAPDQGIQCDYTGVEYVAYPLDIRVYNDQEFEEFADALVAYRSNPDKP